MPPEYSYPSNNSNNKKVILGAILVLIIAGGAFWYLKNAPSTGQVSVREMYNAIILDIQDGKILVQGTVNLPSGEKQQREIEFTITSGTEITKTVMVMDLSIPSDQPYTPKTREEAGDIKDLKVKDSIHMIRSSDNLAVSDKVEAEEIQYLDYIYENRPE